MKKKFKMLMAYLRAFNSQELSFYLNVEEGTIDYLDIQYYDKINKTMMNIIYDIMEEHTDTFYEDGPGSVYSDTNPYYRVSGVIKPFENEIIYEQVDFWVYGTESSDRTYYFNDYEEGDITYDYFLTIRKYLKELKKDDFELPYYGGGDSGAIEMPRDYPMELEEIGYNLLQTFGGWEINEGSQGTIYMTKDYIEIDHTWNTEEEESATLDIKVTEETFN